jgi:hypothetical protein
MTAIADWLQAGEAIALNGLRSVADHLTGIGAAIGVMGTALSVANAMRLYYRDRPDLRLDVYWVWNEGPDDQPSPRIEIVNVGGRSAYIDAIYLTEADGSRHVIGSFDNQEIKPDHKFAYRPNWDEPFDNDPQFRYGWEGLRVVVRNTRGKEWRSKVPTEKPSWFYITPPFDIDPPAVPKLEQG